MAIARDAVTGMSAMAAAATTFTFSHTCSGSNRFLVVGIWLTTVPGSDVVSGITYNGVAMTRAPNGYANAPDNNSTWLYYLDNPDTGANNVVITYVGSQNGCAGAISYTGVDTIDSGNNNTAGPGASSCTVSTTTVADNAWLVGVARADGLSRSFSAGMTAQGTETYQSQMADSNAAKSPAGSYSMTYNATNSSFGLCLLSISPSTATARQNYFTLLDVS